MVQFFGNLESPASQGMGDFSAVLGKGLGEFYTDYKANKRLKNIVNDESYKNADLSEKMEKLQGLQNYGETGLKLLKTQLMAEEQKQTEQTKKSLSNVFEKMQKGKSFNKTDLVGIPPELQLKLMDAQTKRQQELKKQKISGNLKKSMVNAGIPEDVADMWQDLYENSPTGGQSDIVKRVSDIISRKEGSGQYANVESKSKPIVDLEGFEDENAKYDFPPLEESKGLTPKELATQKREREKFNNPIYEKVANKVSALEDESRDIRTLDNIERSGKLPTGIQKWDIDWKTGEPISPSLLEPEAQLYLKTVAHMALRAKEFFPGRVTNFDLENFKKTFPTLANSPEGRKLILKQLELANRIAYLKEETLKSAYEHYGNDSSPSQIRKQADRNYSRLKPELEDRLANLDGMIQDKYQQEISKNLEQTSNKNEVTPGWVLVEFNGQQGEVPENELEEAIKQGAKRL